MTLFESAVHAPVAATGWYSYAWLMVLIPAASAALLLLLGKLSDRWGHLLATLAALSAFVVAVGCFVQMLKAPVAERAGDLHLASWFAVGSWQFDFGMLIDQLSILFALLITGVGSLIHIYSIGYMEHDERRRRFFAYLNLFVAAMLILVLSNNYLTVFLGWEGVGLASYLLIGFWQHKPSAAAAAKKAFVMNRVGDLGMTMAIFTMLAMFGSSAFHVVNEKAAAMPVAGATLIGFFLLLGACGKSAQVPLQGWLLDAMEGPTPVSALIHAATMVTAGVYLVVRSHAIYNMTPTAQLAVAIVGTVTLMAGAWIGCAKDDIKKVLAGSTMSQIGYMMLAAGLGPAGYAFAIFHLITHGFFKANMFLGAGSVMHGMGDDVNMRNFGALAKVMRVTFLTFAMGYLAIIGFPPLAGYFSKDHIIEAAFHQQPILGAMALIGAGITAFYMTRLMIMTFWSAKRWEPGIHPHESPKVMTIPLIVLAILSIVSGALMNGWIQEWLEPAVGNHAHPVSLIPTLVGGATMATVAVGVVIAFMVFGKVKIPKLPPVSKSPFTIAGRNDLFGDAFNDTVVVKPVMATAKLAAKTDEVVIDGTVDGMATGVQLGATALSRLQTGYIRSYALAMVFGFAIIAAAVIIGQWI